MRTLPALLGALLCASLGGCLSDNPGARPAVDDAANPDAADRAPTDADPPAPDAQDLAPDAARDPDAALDAEPGDARLSDAEGFDAEPSADASSDAALPTAPLAGTVTFEDRPVGPEGLGPPTVAPGRNLRVQALAADGAVLAEGLTDLEGRFVLAVPGEGPVRVQVLSAAAAGVLDGAVRDRSRAAARYGVISEELSKESDSWPEVELHATADTAGGAALHIADTMGVALRGIAAHTDAGAPTLTIRWQAGRAFDCGSCYGGDEVSLGAGLEDTDEFDDAIILHEIGHWFVHRFSADDSPGGTHRDRQVEPRLAYGEGIAYFFAALLLDTPLSIDTFADSERVIDLEAVSANGVVTDDLRGTTDGTAGGRLREEVVAGLMWDAYDAADPAEPFDTVSIGVEGNFRIWLDDFPGANRRADVGARGIDVADWLVALGCHLGATAEGPPEGGADGEPLDPVFRVDALSEAAQFPFEVDASVAGGACAEKGRVPSPFTLMQRDGQVWLVPRPDADPEALRDLLLRAGGAEPGSIDGRKARPLGPATPEARYLVTRPGAPWAGASHLGEAVLARLAGGKLSGGPDPVRVQASVSRPGARR